ncbi:hypothetical protein ACA910_019623 [Epithemia clementina (nom. ined.)]
MAKFFTLRQPVQVVVASASIAITIYRIIIWRARTRAKKSVDRMREIIETDGPLIDIHDDSVRNRILERAIRRASTWMTLAHTQKARPMIGQVGGASYHKKPLLTLSPEYVLKPVLTDHRGIREIAFYEAMAEAVLIANNHHNRHHSRQQAYASFLKGNNPLHHPISTATAPTSVFFRVREIMDTLALAFALVLKDKVVVASEAAVEAAWRTIKREVEVLRTLSKFTAPYYGIVGLEAPSVDTPFGVTEDTHLLLHNLTSNYAQPVVMDLKMGTQSFEPDAPLEKRRKEQNKYLQQKDFGFRIVGMRIFQPHHPEADKSGYVFFDKHYGRGLETREQVKQALRIYFGAGLQTSDSCYDEQASQGHYSTSNGYPSNHQHNSSKSALNITTNGNHISQNPEKQHQNEEDDVVKRSSNKNGNSKADAKISPRQRLRVKSISNLLVQLRSIQRWFEEHNKGLQFYASSLLWIYEGQLSCQAPDVTTLKMIDFGRVRRVQFHEPSKQKPKQEPQHQNNTKKSRQHNHNHQHQHAHSHHDAVDPGYLRGLQTLQQFLVELIKEAKKDDDEEEDAYRGDDGTAKQRAVSPKTAI